MPESGVQVMPSPFRLSSGVASSLRCPGAPLRIPPFISQLLVMSTSAGAVAGARPVVASKVNVVPVLPEPTALSG